MDGLLCGERVVINENDERASEDNADDDFDVLMLKKTKSKSKNKRKYLQKQKFLQQS